MGNTVYFVVPCYNEEEVLPETSKQLYEKMKSLVLAGKVSPDSRICFVDDGSKDRTWELIEELHAADPVFAGVKLSRNRGHQNALLGGMMTVKDDCDAIVSLDADLQDDPDAIDKMVDEWIGGAGHRNMEDALRYMMPKEQEIVKKFFLEDKTLLDISIEMNMSMDLLGGYIKSAEAQIKIWM